MSVERALTDTIVTALAAVVATGDGEQPDDVGWSGVPEASTFVPYCVLHPLPGGYSTGSIEEPHADAEILYQVSCYGATRAQCQFVVDTVHEVMLDHRPVSDDVVVRHVDDDMLGGARRDDTAQPRLWMATPRYRFYTSGA